jgi:hypothetical protein
MKCQAEERHSPIRGRYFRRNIPPGDQSIPEIPGASDPASTIQIPPQRQRLLYLANLIFEEIPQMEAVEILYDIFR